MSEPGKKYDGEKPRMHLLPPHALEEVAKVLTFGAKKYSEENWRKVENLQKRYASAALRHVTEILKGNDLDDETGLHHEAHAICCLLFMLEDKMLSEKERNSILQVAELVKIDAVTPSEFEKMIPSMEGNVAYPEMRFDISESVVQAESRHIPLGTFGVSDGYGSQYLDPTELKVEDASELELERRMQEEMSEEDEIPF